MCYWCFWGWPKPIRDIYDDCAKRLGSELPLLYGPGHVVWSDENWRSAQACLDHFDEWQGGYSANDLPIIRESLERLIEVPDEYKTEPNGFDAARHDPADFPPPDHWRCEAR